jgi:hypothetical protein
MGSRQLPNLSAEIVEIRTDLIDVKANLVKLGYGQCGLPGSPDVFNA